MVAWQSNKNENENALAFINLHLHLFLWVCGCVGITSQRSVLMFCLPKLHICFLTFVSDLILTLFQNFVFRFPLEVNILLGMVNVMLVWYGYVLFFFLVAKYFYHKRGERNFNIFIRCEQQIKWLHTFYQLHEEQSLDYSALFLYFRSVWSKSHMFTMFPGWFILENSIN